MGSGAPDDPRPGAGVLFRHVLPVAFGLAGTAIVLFITSRFGIGLAPDSANYLAAARSLIAGRGLLCFDRTPFVSWPPLYPALLAPLGLTGDILVPARFPHALIFGAFVFATFRLLRIAFESKPLVIVGTLFTLGSSAVLYVSAQLLSDGIFCLLVVLFLTVLSRLTAQPGPRTLALCCLLAALLCLQRYVGLAIVLGGGVAGFLWPRDAPSRRRLARAGVILGSGLLPLAGWLTRNYALASTLTGPRAAVSRNLLHKLAMTADVVGNWFYPGLNDPALGPIAQVVFGFLLAGLAAAALVNVQNREARGAAAVRTSTVFAGIYLLVLVAVSSIVAIDEVSPRLLAPIFVTMVFVVLAGLRSIGCWLGTKCRRPAVGRLASAAVAVVLLVFPLIRSARLVQMWRTRGFSVYTREEWRSPLVEWLREHRLQGKVLSNDPAAVYLLAGIPAVMTPRLTEDPESMFRDGKIQAGDHIVWFAGVGRPYLHPVEELARVLPLDMIHAESDGGVLIVTQLSARPE